MPENTFIIYRQIGEIGPVSHKVPGNYEITLTPEELENAYQSRQNQYLMEDAGAAIEQWLEGNNIGSTESPMCPPGLNWEEVKENMVRDFQKSHDCNCPENDMWETIADSCLKPLFFRYWMEALLAKLDKIPDSDYSDYVHFFLQKVKASASKGHTLDETIAGTGLRFMSALKLLVEENIWEDPKRKEIFTNRILTDIKQKLEITQETLDTLPPIPGFKPQAQMPAQDEETLRGNLENLSTRELRVLLEKTAYANRKGE